MKKTTEQTILKSLKNIENNFASLTKNQNLKSIVTGLKKHKGDWKKRIELMLHTNISDLKNGTKNDLRAINKFINEEKQKLKDFQNAQNKEIKNIISTAEKYFNTQKKRFIKKPGKKKTATKASAKKIASRKPAIKKAAQKQSAEKPATV